MQLVLLVALLPAKTRPTLPNTGCIASSSCLTIYLVGSGHSEKQTTKSTKRVRKLENSIEWGRGGGVIQMVLFGGNVHLLFISPIVTNKLSYCHSVFSKLSLI